MASLKDCTGDGTQGSHGVEFLPLVADVAGWIGLFVCADTSCGDPWSLTEYDARGRDQL